MALLSVVTSLLPSGRRQTGSSCEPAKQWLIMSVHTAHGENTPSSSGMLSAPRFLSSRSSHSLLVQFGDFHFIHEHERRLQIRNRFLF